MKRFITILICVLIGMSLSAQTTYKSTAIKLFDKYEDLVSEKTVSSLVTVATGSVTVDTKGLTKKVFYRIDEDPATSKSVNQGFILDKQQEYVIDVLPSTYRTMSEQTKLNHLYLMTVTDVYLQSGMLCGSMIDFAGGDGYTRRYIFE